MPPPGARAPSHFSVPHGTVEKIRWVWECSFFNLSIAQLQNCVGTFLTFSLGPLAVIFVTMTGSKIV